ncbi:MobC family plasmid mobilization relaxosome protein [Sphingomonas suaedae]|uniref:MobC family plasmid mobilization relaxosome protein n=1 Tax=Sphingomonas suaedae TaxID=2599297 RepID=A0A518RE79_9SPHN|nr:plasmid mobilization relaxosome protein MobC [Sphingomonas suaedae]QDX25739.1 MobC family plasmid mobilization relaxosome protein [Sphingomonas suaedae]
MPEKKKREAPLSLRLSRDERARLERDAAGMTLGAYIKWRLFDPNTPPPRTRGKAPVRDHAILSHLLAMLGNLRLASNVNQLAKAANSGSLPVTPEVAAALMQACREIAEMRRMLMKALGLDAGGDSP